MVFRWIIKISNFNFIYIISNSSGETESRAHRLRQNFALDPFGNHTSIRSGELYRTNSEIVIPRSRAHSPTASSVSDVTTNAEEMSWEELTDELEFQKTRVCGVHCIYSYCKTF